MERTLSAQELFKRYRDRLELNWIAGRDSGDSRKVSSASIQARRSLVGYLSLIHPNDIQVLGVEENQWLDGLDAKLRWETVARMFDSQPVALMVANDLSVPDDLIDAARETCTPLFSTPIPSYELVAFLEYQVARTLARRISLHGVFMEVFTIGVLITGEPGCGKSELALELLTRGHRLIADDAPEFTQISPEIIDGTCPAVLRDCLEVRGLGILNVREMFGDSAVKANKFLRLIIHLNLPGEGPADSGGNRLAGDLSKRQVLDLEIPQITLPVLAGRNLAVIVEAAVRDFMLKMKGFDAAAEFIERHSYLMRER